MSQALRNWQQEAIVQAEENCFAKVSARVEVDIRPNVQQTFEKLPKMSEST